MLRSLWRALVHVIPPGLYLSALVVSSQLIGAPAWLAAQDTSPPRVATITPTEHAAGVPGSVQITIAFSKAIDPATATAGNLRLLSGGQAVATSITVSADARSVILTPSAPLPAERRYTVVVGTGVRDRAGNPLDREYRWTFARGTGDFIALEPIEVWGTLDKSQARRAETFAFFSTEEMRHDDEISPYAFFKRVPSVNLVEGHALGYGLRNPVAGRIQIRGIGRKAGVDMRVRGVLLLMDGVPDFSVTHGHPLPDIFSRSYVDEIEIIKGPASVRYGWAQAGVVLMRSRDPIRLGSSGYLGASVGSWGTTQNLASYNYRWEDGFIQASGAVRRSAGHRDNSATSAVDGRIRLAQAISPNVNFVASARGGRNTWEIPGAVGGNPGVGGDNNWFIADVGTRVRAGAWDITFKAWGFDAQVEFEDGLTEPNEALGGRIKLESAAWQGGTFTFGTDVMTYRIGRGPEDDVVRSKAPFEIGPYVWLTHETGPVILTGGARFTYNDQFGEDLSPEVGLVIRPVASTAFRLRAAHGFRAPNPFEFAFGSAQNPGLEATDLWQYEVGWNQQLGDYVTLDIVGWLQDGDNMIRTVFDETVQDVRNMNTGAFTHHGLEAQLTLRTLQGFVAGVAAAVMDLDAETALVPQNTIDFHVGYESYGFRAMLDGRWADDLFQRDNEEVPLPNYLITDLTFGYRLPTGVGFRWKIENLFDEDYQLFSGWPMPGVSVFGGVDYAF